MPKLEKLFADSLIAISFGLREIKLSDLGNHYANGRKRRTNTDDR
jgi:hypothetical protein